MAKPLVSDELWDVVAPLLPPPRPKPKGGRPPISDRAALSGILFVLKSGIPRPARGRLVGGYSLSSVLTAMISFFFASALCADALMSQTDCGCGRVKAVSRAAGARQRAP